MNEQRTKTEEQGTRSRHWAREKVQEKRKKERETEDGKVVGMRSRAHRNSGEHKSELRYWWRGNGSKKRWVTTHTHCSRGEEVKEGNQARRRREGHAP